MLLYVHTYVLVVFVVVDIVLIVVVVVVVVIFIIIIHTIWDAIHSSLFLCCAYHDTCMCVCTLSLIHG